MCKRESTGPEAMCSGCKGRFKKSQAGVRAPRPTATAASTTSSIPVSEWDNVWQGMDNDATLDIIKSDDVIKEIGKSIYNTRKPTKENEARVKARAAASHGKPGGSHRRCGESRGIVSSA